MTAISKVLADPLNSDFSKNLPSNYKAVDVLQQYRLFFRIESDPYTGGQVIFFVWINDESSIHRTGKPDDCYEIFRKMVERGEIESYQPDPPIQDGYRRYDDWGDSHIYLSYEKTILSQPPQHQHADTSLVLSKVTAQDYLIQHISVSHEGQGLASALLSELCADADKAKVSLNYELFSGSENANKSRHLLAKFYFRVTDTIDDIEVWTRKVRS